MSRVPAVPVGHGADALPWTTLAELVDSAADRYGEREVFRDERHRAITFAQLSQLTRSIAAEFVAEGLRPGERVALMMANTLWWPVLWLSVVRAGGVVVPVNKTYRAADLSFVLQDSGARLVIADEQTSPVMQAVLGDCRSISVVYQVEPGSRSLLRVIAHGVAEPAKSGGPWEGVANLQYTSGTTGFPKACVLSEQYWLRAGWLAAEVAELGDDDTVLTAQPFSYIDPQWQSVMCLIAGSTLVILPRFSASGYWPAIREHHVTFAYVLGTMPVILFKQPASAVDTQHSLRLMLCSGIPVDLHRAFEQRWGVPWREAYGMTETGIDLAVPAEAQESVGSGIAGRVVATKRTRVVDQEGADVPINAVGELWLHGEPMMLRYHERPDETAAAIVNGWLRTGDLVRRDADGWVRVVGRLKDMVRRAGENIAAAEVEGVLAGHPDVAMSAVVPVPDPVTEEEVKAFVQLRGGEVDLTDTARSIASHAAAQLAKFKVPRWIEFVEAFELTPSERVVKSALRREDQRTGAFDVQEDRWL